jgi:hypothetical protein
MGNSFASARHCDAAAGQHDVEAAVEADIGQPRREALEVTIH